MLPIINGGQLGRKTSQRSFNSGTLNSLNGRSKYGKGNQRQLLLLAAILAACFLVAGLHAYRLGGMPSMQQGDGSSKGAAGVERRRTAESGIKGAGHGRSPRGSARPLIPQEDLTEEEAEKQQHEWEEQQRRHQEEDQRRFPGLPKDFDAEVGSCIYACVRVRRNE